MAVYTKKWNGSAWVTAPFKKWNGSAWVDSIVWKWNGSAWVQIYPETIVTHTQTLIGGNFRTHRSAGSSQSAYWTANARAKQGPWESYGNAKGYLGVSSASLVGSGSISSITSCSMTAKRGGAGYYNNDQTIYFYRSSAQPETIPTDLTSSTGPFTTTTGGPGSGNMMTDRPVNVNSFTLNWVNQVSSKPYLWITTSNSTDYLSIEETFKMTLTYKYTAVSALFEDTGNAVAYNMSRSAYNNNGGSKVYHDMVIYNDEVGMTLNEIMERRYDGIVEDINPDNIILTSEITPWFREYNVIEENGQLKFKIEAMHLNMNSEVQYSVDNNTWNTMYGDKDSANYVQGVLPSDFNKYHDIIYVRIIDKTNDCLYTDTIVEPKILI